MPRSLAAPFCALIVMLAAQPLAATAQTASDVPRVEVLRVQGVIDPSIAGYV
ncbi:MAG: hypothetical protein H0W94_02670, partial [Actinobacteria bacterium]|nr:hypothetical protein [Actinomycetota bacterium]